MLSLFLHRQTEVFHKQMTVVEVAPWPKLAAELNALDNVHYVGIDLGRHRDINICTSLTELGLRSASVDLLICFHVLEHIPDDIAAMREIRRVLKPHGIGVLQVPLQTGLTDEDFQASAKERIRRFGQADHVRHYGRDFEERLATSGLDIQRFAPSDYINPNEVQRFAIAGDDHWIFAVQPGLT